MSDAGRKREAIKPVVNMTVEQDVFRAPEGGKAMSEFVPLQFEDVGKMRVELEQARAEIERLRADLSFFSVRLVAIAKDHEQWERDYKHTLKTEVARLREKIRIGEQVERTMALLLDQQAAEIRALEGK